MVLVEEGSVEAGLLEQRGKRRRPREVRRVEHRRLDAEASALRLEVPLDLQVQVAEWQERREDLVVRRAAELAEPVLHEPSD